MTGYCEHCGHASDALDKTTGILFCPACLPKGVACEAYTHDWLGSRTPGVWLCLRCPARMGSEVIGTEPAQAPMPLDADLW